MAVLLWALFAVVYVPKKLGRLLVPPSARQMNVVGPSPMLRNRVIAGTALIAVICLLFGWQGRIGRRWIAGSTLSSGLGRLPPVYLNSDQITDVFSSFLVSFANSRDRTTALAFLLENSDRDTLERLVSAEAGERDSELRVLELHLISIWRSRATIPLFITRLRDTDSHIRAAAADALGIIRQPSYSISDTTELDSKPPIAVYSVINPPSSSMRSPSRDGDLFAGAPQSIDLSIRESLQKMLTDGSTQLEREAAARTLVSWPPDIYRLRLAEWGIWIDNQGHMAMAKRVIEEIPPFVHQTGNRLNTFDEYFNHPTAARFGYYYPTFVTKPVIHLTADRPMAVDLEVHIRDGRPWYAFPHPTNFGLGLEKEFATDTPLWIVRLSVPPPPSPPSQFNPGSINPILDLHYGYPWLSPKHYIYNTDSTGTRAIYDIGLQWQSLIVSPARLPWMKPPAVPTDPKFRWWERLRDVPSSWISAFDDTERFLYYDGPTRRQVPLRVSLQPSTRTLTFTAPNEGASRADGCSDAFHPVEPLMPENLPHREGLYIELLPDGILRGQYIAIGPKDFANLENNLPLQSEAVIDRLRQMLTSYGLTTPEADGLIAAWSPQFFHTEGRRFILRMSPEDYAAQCPIAVRPAPTELVRLGLILTEFDVVENHKVDTDAVRH